MDQLIRPDRCGWIQASWTMMKWISCVFLKIIPEIVGISFLIFFGQWGQWWWHKYAWHGWWLLGWYENFLGFLAFFKNYSRNCFCLLNFFGQWLWRAYDWQEWWLLVCLENFFGFLAIFKKIFPELFFGSLFSLNSEDNDDDMRMTDRSGDYLCGRKTCFYL